MEEKKFNIDECNDVGVLKGRIMFLESNMGSLLRQIGGYKASQVNYRKRIESLLRDIEKEKAYGKEADEMLNKRICENDSLKHIIEEKNGLIQDLQMSHRETRAELENVKNECDLLKKEYKELINRPWYKRIFG